MTPTETGLYGPGDYEGFETIDGLIRVVEHLNRTTPKVEYYTDHFKLWARQIARDAILDLAEDLDERGLVLVGEPEAVDLWDAAYSDGYADGTSDANEYHRISPSSPNTGS